MAPFVLGNGNTAIPGLWPHSRCCGEAVPAAVENPGGVLEGGSGHRSVQSLFSFWIQCEQPVPVLCVGLAPAALAVPRFGNGSVPAAGTAHLVVLYILLPVEVGKTLKV